MVVTQSHGKGRGDGALFREDLIKAVMGTLAVMKVMVFARLLMLKLDLKCF
jgi:hypothetical protein